MWGLSHTDKHGEAEMLNNRNVIWKRLIWGNVTQSHVGHEERKWDICGAQKVTRFITSPHPDVFSSPVSVTLGRRKCDNQTHICTLLPSLTPSHHPLPPELPHTLVMSMGRPDFAAETMGSSPLACRRCCAAAVMSCTHTDRHTVGVSKTKRANSNITWGKKQNHK